MTAASAMVAIVCAILVVILVLMLVGYQFWQRYSHRQEAEPAQEQAESPEAQVQIAPQALEVVPPQPLEVEPLMPVVPPAPAIAPVAVPAQEPEYNPAILSKDIVAQLKGASPAQAEVVKKKYLGKKVDWTLYFSNMMMKSANNMEVTLLNENNDYPMVSFLVDFVAKPQVTQLRQGTQVTVKGEIDQIFNFYIVLRNVQFSIGPTPGTL